MQNKDYRYKAYIHLNEPLRFFGLKPADELIPVIIFAALGFALTSSFMGILALALGYLITIKYLKFRYDERFLIIFLYWHANKNLSKFLFKHTPPACLRFFIGSL